MTDMTHDDMTCDTFAERLGDYLEGDASTAEREAIEAHAAHCTSCGALLADLMMIPHEAAALPLLVPSHDLWSGIAERIDARVLPLETPRTARVVPLLRRGWARPAIAAAALVLFTASVTHVLTRASLSPVAAVVPVATAPVTRQQVASPTPDVSVPTAQLVATTTTQDPAPRATTGRTTTAGTGAAPRNATLRLASSDPLLEDVEPVYDREIGKLRRIVLDRHSQLDPATIAVLEQSVAVIDSAIAQSRAALAKDPASGFLANQLNHSLEKKVELLRTAAMLPART